MTTFPAKRSPPTCEVCQTQSSSASSVSAWYSGRPCRAQQRSCLPCVQTSSSGWSSGWPGAVRSRPSRSSCDSSCAWKSEAPRSGELPHITRSSGRPRRSERRTKRSFVLGRAAACSRRFAFTWSERPLPGSTSWPQRPRYSTRIQWSTRLAVPARGSRFSRETSEQKGLSLGIWSRRDDADDLPSANRLARGDGQLADDTGARRLHLVLHLHRLDD